MTALWLSILVVWGGSGSFFELEISPTRKLMIKSTDISHVQNTGKVTVNLDWSEIANLQQPSSGIWTELVDNPAAGLQTYLFKPLAPWPGKVIPSNCLLLIATCVDGTVQSFTADATSPYFEQGFIQNILTAGLPSHNKEISKFSIVFERHTIYAPDSQDHGSWEHQHCYTHTPQDNKDEQAHSFDSFATFVGSLEIGRWLIVAVLSPGWEVLISIINGVNVRLMSGTHIDVVTDCLGTEVKSWAPELSKTTPHHVKKHSLIHIQTCIKAGVFYAMGGKVKNNRTTFTLNFDPDKFIEDHVAGRKDCLLKKPDQKEYN
ncbi:hypothetical protein BDK51DRAFT_26171 [Blyttiomyces helicus]|uniref:Uncharacterized protein n=1 Tax=Blyttiomyces helicus TaxID=388810 RepID=A0A4P9WAF7_9FUNG|nr:hypothetical protein BDK51DRAFT_26171 [Blyttiomyces helicus]|eukprot:RKO89424.1 hypothetical protein BDK51DRAFT_26171 [Blyttiomyces helicus]